MSALKVTAQPAQPTRPEPTRAPNKTDRTLREVTSERRGAIVARRFGWVSVFVIIVGLFGVAGFHSVIIQQQRQVDGLGAELAEVSERNSELRVQLTQLEAPARILSVARDELGMVYVEPADVQWLDPADPGALAHEDTVSAQPQR